MINKARQAVTDAYKRYFSHEIDQQIKTPTDVDAHFLLQYEELQIGELWLHEGVWHFQYTDAFRQQSDLQPLFDFPDLGKHYESDQLWPFFRIRIPSLEQPAVKKVVEREKIDKENEVELLARFGKRTIANPFHLKAA